MINCERSNSITSFGPRSNRTVLQKNRRRPSISLNVEVAPLDLPPAILALRSHDLDPADGLRNRT